MLALGLLASALGVINDGWPGLLNGLLAIVVSLVILFVLVPLDLRQQARAEKKPDDQ
jgi:uncharacterized membrane protein